MNKKLFRFFFDFLIPRPLKNVLLMLRFNCIIHPFANIMFANNIYIGKGTKIGKCDIICQGKIHIGNDCLINDYVILNSKTGLIYIGNNTTINNFSIIHGNGGVVIGNHCAIAPGVKIVKNHKINGLYEEYLPVSEKKTTIGDFVWVCTNVVIIDGVTIGDNVVIGANSFVNHDLEESYIYAGNPVRPIHKRK